MLKQLRNAAIIFVMALVFSACGNGGNVTARRDDHLKRGDQFLANKQAKEAIIEYLSAVQLDKLHGPAHQKLGEAYLQGQNPEKAFAEFVRAADLLPNDLSAQLRAGQILLIAGRYDDARGRAEKVLAVDSKNIEALVLKGNALAGLKDMAGALSQAEAAISAEPGRSSGFEYLGALQSVHGDPKQAEASFKRAVALDPKSVSARLSLANLYWSTKRTTEAEAALKEAAALDPKNPLPIQALAMVYLGSRRIAEAEVPLKTLAQTMGAKGKLILADYYVRVRRLSEAKALYEEVATGAEHVVRAKLRLASLGFADDRAGAKRIVDEILAKDPTQVEALVARAQLQLQEGRPDEALKTARAAVASAPNVPSVHFVLGLALKAQYQTDEARAALKDALQVDPSFAPAVLELARMELAASRFESAADYAQTAVSLVPGNGDAYLLLARAQLATGKAVEAARILGMVVASFPDSAGIQAELGRLLIVRGDAAGAATALTRALTKEPHNVAALEAMVALEVFQKQIPAARKRLDAAVAAAPKDGDLQLMAGRLYARLFEDWAAAETTIKRALSAGANTLVAYDLLARLYMQQNKVPAATAELERLAKLEPKSAENHTGVGVMYQLQGRIPEAKAAYERALSINPKAALASNNLAQIYVDQNQNLEVALQLAQTAKAGLPTAHEVDDTLGWIYYRKGMGGLAVAALGRAVAAQPDNPVYLYHLGAAHALNKQKANARQALEKALKLQQNFPGADDARKLLDSVK